MVKRVAMLTDNADPLVPLGGHEAGGENVYVFELSRVLGRLGWTVDIFTRWSSPKTAQIAKVSDNVRVIRLPAGPLKFIPKEQLFPHMPAYVESFLAFKDKTKIDYLILHGNYYLSGWAGIQLAKILKVPLVNTFHTLGIVKHTALGAEDPSPVDRIDHEKEIMNEADRVIATSPPMKEELTHFYNVSPKKIAVIGEGANLKRFQPLPQLVARRVLRFSQNRLIVLFIGRIEKRKGVDTLLHATAEVAETLGNKRKLLRVYISGGDPRGRGKKNTESVESIERKRLNALIDKLKIGDVVRMVGGIDRENIPYYYSAADVTVVPSYYEPFGLVPLESMACGTPVVASRVGGMQWTVKDGKTGYLVPPRDAKEFAVKIHFLLTHPSVGKAMRENGIERVKHLFSWEKVGSQMSNFYNDLIIEYFYRQLYHKTNGKSNGVAV